MVEFPVIYSRFTLVIYFIYVSIHMSIPISQFISSFQPLYLYIHFQCQCLYFYFANNSIPIVFLDSFNILFNFDLSEDAEYISLCYTVGPSSLFFYTWQSVSMSFFLEGVFWKAEVWQILLFCFLVSIVWFTLWNSLLCQGC